jgi:hypothetical protein
MFVALYAAVSGVEENPFTEAPTIIKPSGGKK